MNEKIYVPPIKIQGIKTKIVPTIKKNVAVDENTLWIEPFMGSGVVGFNIKPHKAIFADINPYIIDFYAKLKNKTITSYIIRQFLEEEGKILAEKDDAYYYEVRNRFNKEHNPLDFLFLNRSCLNGMIRFNKDYKFNVPYGHKPERFSKSYITKIVNQAKYIEECLTMYDWEFICSPFDETIKKANKNSFVYCDPPYIGRNVDYYDSWNEEQEIKLCNILKNIGCRFMLSTWDHNDYRENIYIESLWSFCFKMTKEHFYHVGANEENRNAMIEALLTNYKLSNDNNKLSLENEQLRLA